MKYLEVEVLTHLNVILKEISIGNITISGNTACYSLKMIQEDKKLTKHLKREYSDEEVAKCHVNQNKIVNDNQLGNSINEILQTPFGNLREQSTIRLFSYMISTLNGTYIDYDFTDIPPQQFREEQPNSVNEVINARLTPVEKQMPGFLDRFWKTINDVIDLKDCKFITFSPSDDVLQSLRAGSLWNIDLFIINDKKKQLLYFTLFAMSNLFPKKDGATDDMFEMKVDDEEVETTTSLMGILDENEEMPSFAVVHDDNNYGYDDDVDEENFNYNNTQ